MKDDILHYISRTNIPMIVFVLYVLNMIVFGANIADAIGVFAISAVYGYKVHLDRKAYLWDKAVEKEILELKQNVESLKHKLNAKAVYEKKDRPAGRMF